MDNRHLNTILDCMDGYQKDYYKQCTLVDILLSDSWNQKKMIIFGKTREELNHHELNDTYAYRTMLHYPYIVQVSYPYGASKEEIITTLKDNNISYKDISWYDNALVVNTNEDTLRELDIYKEGKIYLQSLSSQLPPLFLNPQENEMILDMAAAPGGKTTEIAALSNNKAMITAIEKNKIRSERLQYNIDKQGAKKVTVLNTDARNLNEYFMFDKILLDAPCSGSGTITNNNFNNFDEDLVNRSIKKSTCIRGSPPVTVIPPPL